MTSKDNIAQMMEKLFSEFVYEIGKKIEKKILYYVLTRPVAGENVKEKKSQITCIFGF